MLPGDVDTAAHMVGVDGSRSRSGRRIIVLTMSLVVFTATFAAFGGHATDDDAPHVITVDPSLAAAADTTGMHAVGVDPNREDPPRSDGNMRCVAAIRAAVGRVLVAKAGWVKAPEEASAPAAPATDDTDAVDAKPTPLHEATAPLLYFPPGISYHLPDHLSPIDAAPVARLCKGSSPMQGIHINFTRFDRHRAFQCLAGKSILMYGNSNTRTLYTALEALLRGTRQVGRVLAKQRCDNSKRNHSCSTEVTLDGYAPVRLFYWGYVRDVFHHSMHSKMVASGQIAAADYVLGNAGANVIQGTPDGKWEPVYHDKNVESRLSAFVAAVRKPGAQFWWHTTTRLCEHQRHFTRYKYDPKYWSGRSLDTMNAAVSRSNYLADELLRRIARPVEALGGAPIGVLDGAHLVAADAQSVVGLPGGGVCPHFDDPLHHRFLDRELVQLLLNAWCFEPQLKSDG